MGVFFSPAPQKKTLEAPEKEGKARLVPGKNFDFGTEVSLVFPPLVYVESSGADIPDPLGMEPASQRCLHVRSPVLQYIS